MIEWARLLLQDIGRIYGLPPKRLGDPTCVGYTGSVPNYQLPAGKGCSGIEGMIIPHRPTTDFTKDPGAPCPGPTCLDPGANADLFNIYPSILKPGGASGAFCIDPGVESDCTADGGKSVFQNALTHVARVAGQGSTYNLPAELQDRRYYFKWFGVAYVKYLKAYGNYVAKYGTAVNQFPNGTIGGGLGPSDVMNQQIDLESLFFDYAFLGNSTFDKFEYVDRDFIGQGSGGAYNWIPWDFEYGCDLFGGNQRYDNWFRRMDREEIAMYSAMLTDKTHTAGQENNVNITNLFGSLLLGGDPAAAIRGAWPSYACAIGQAGDPATNCGRANAPLDVTLPSGATPCTQAKDCTVPGQTCAGGFSYESGFVQACGAKCDFTVAGQERTGCASPTQTCAVRGPAEGCLDMKMDKNGPNAATPHPLLWAYPGAWTRTPFSRGHSPITLAAADKHPNIGVAKISIPNFKVDAANPYTTGPYTVSPMLAAGGMCNTGYTLSTNGVWCNAAVNSGTGYMVPAFTSLTPWAEVQPAVGFSIPLDAQHNQWVSTGQLDFEGVLETYVVDYLPYTDPAKASCVSDGACNQGFACNRASHSCVTDDDTVRIAAIEGKDFLGQAFVCIDPTTHDILHVGMYDSGVAILNWLAAHPGSDPGTGNQPSAQTACQILIIRSPIDNYVDFIVSKAYGVLLNMGGGQGQGRVTDIVLFDPNLIQSL
jgi:hypothetical protein